MDDINQTSGPTAMMDAPKRQTELEVALAAARDSCDRVEQQIALLAGRLEPVLAAAYLQQPEETDTAGVPAGSMRAVEVFAIASRLDTAAGKLDALRDALEV